MNTPNIIDLNRNDAGTIEGSGTPLQTEALSRLHRVVSNQLETIEKLSNADSSFSGTALSYPRTHQAVLIQGGRGSGKTTFLLNALSTLPKPDSAFARQHKDKAEKFEALHILPPIDPTLIEAKDKIILIIISLIEAAIGKKRTSCDDEPYRDLEKARGAVAGGLSLLDGIGNAQPYEGWEDDAWIMSKGLEKAEKSRFFERKFNKYLEEALKILNKKAFVLSFDDIDTNFQIGYTILEVIRKYLSSPRLILLISGDIDLYSRLVRKNIYEIFGKNVLSYDPDMRPLRQNDDHAHMPNAIRELEEQYLLKIIPSQNRIAMSSLAEILQTGTEIRIKTSQEDGDGTELKKWFYEKIDTLLHSHGTLEDKNSPYVKRFFSVISKEHLRLIISYLRAIKDAHDQQVRFSIFSVFNNRLSLNNIDSLTLSESDFYVALNTAFHWFLSQDNPAELARLGTSNETDKMIILHCLTIAAAYHLKKSPAKILESFLALNLPLSMMNYPPYTQRKIRDAMFEFLWNESTWNGQELNIIKIAGRIGGIARFNEINTDQTRKVLRENLSPSCFGDIGLANPKNKHKNTLFKEIYGVSQDNDSLEKLSISVQEASDGITKKKYRKWFFPKWPEILMKSKNKQEKNSPKENFTWFSLSQVIERCNEFGIILDAISYKYYNGKDSLTYISSISLLSLVTALLNLEHFPDSSMKLKAFLNDNKIESPLPKFYSDELEINNVEQSDFSNEDEDDDDYQGTNGVKESSPEWEDFFENLKQWYEFSQETIKRLNVNINIFTPLADRLHDNLISLDERITFEWRTGNIFHRQITNLLYTFLSLSSYEKERSESPKERDDVLFSLIKKIVESITSKEDNISHIHPMSICLISCPVFWLFMDHTMEYSSGAHGHSLMETTNHMLETFIQKLNSELPSGEEGEKEKKNVYQIKEHKITMKVAQTHEAETKGFFDILNVVPHFTNQK